MPSSPEPDPPLSRPNDSVFIAEAQLLLAEKRTSLATVRTGIALFALPLAILSALIATSKMYDSADVLHFLVPVLVVCAFLIILAGYLSVRAIRRIRRQDALLEKLRMRSPRLAEMLD